jgi:O-antigen ligase/tetratricopeptide (TPR) repeat protein
MPGRGSATYPSTVDADRLPAARWTRAAGEAVLLALALLSPWAFGSAEPTYEFLLTAGVLLLAALWAAHAALSGAFHFRPDFVSACLGGLALWSMLQLVPLPAWFVGVVSPAWAEWHRTLLPEQLEVLPGEAGPVPRSGWLPLTVEPSATQTFLARVLGALVVYAAARNWLASRASFVRLGWAATANGVALAVFALGHLMSAPRGTVYWTIPVDGSGAFGPFINRNHYPDYVALCAGLGLGLLLPRRSTSRPPELRDWLLAPQGLLLAGAIALMLSSVPFSLSRGGMLAVLAAVAGTWLLARAGGRGRGGLAVLVVVGVVGLALAAWFGTGAVEKRLGTLVSGEAAESRLPLWRDALRLVPGTWLTGTGGGTFASVEPTVRTHGGVRTRNAYAHNEYLEALVEGGVVRIGLTAALAVGVLVVVGRGHLRRRDRTVGPWLLGCWFGLAVVAAHAVGEFAVHIPAVAVMTAVVAGFAVALTDPEFAPPGKREGEKRRRGEEEPKTVASLTPSPPHALTPSVLSLLVAGAALFAALGARDRDRAERLRVDALRAYWDPERDDNLAARAAFLDRRAAVRPGDPQALTDAAAAHIDLAVLATWTPGAGLAGGAAGYSAAPDRIPPAVAERHLYTGLRYLREARAANPLTPRAHARLGVYAEYFRSSEPAAVHFARAKRLLPVDPDIWFYSGREALARGDEAAAWADWRQSLAQSSRHLGSILQAARDKLSADEIRTKLLPGDPAVLLAAANTLYPDPAAQAAERRPFLEAIAAADRPDLPIERLMIVADALAWLGRPDEAAAVWRRAADAEPDRRDVRDRYAGFLEAEERYEEAVEQLEWLRREQPRNEAYRDRLDAARHGLKLRQEIFGE